jgi:hypothetical protein
MRRFTTLTICLLLLACFGVTTAWATSPHYKKAPVGVDNGFTFTATGSIAGLGNFDVFISLRGSAIVNTVCTSPGGGTEAPGQNPALTVDVSGGVFIGKGDIKNGNLAFAVTTTPPATPPPTGPNGVGCANDNWGVRITDVTFSNVQLRIFQDINNDGTFTDGTGGTLNELVIGPTSLP